MVRDLHDGAQQRFVQAIITLELALRAFETDDEGGRALVAEALEHAKAANRELRELAHGLLPDVLTTRGLAAGVESIADGLHVPVDVSVPDGRFPAEIEATANFLVAEALTNVAKHADARHANVAARVEDGSLPDRRLRRRRRRRLPGRKRAAGPPRSRRELGGDLELDSPPGGGTRIAVTLPLV